MPTAVPRLNPKDPMTRFLSLCALALAGLASPIFAECAGRNLFAEMSAERVAGLHAATDAVPFSRGNFWRATRGDEVITLAGTYHFDDPRHDANLAALTPHIQSATTVLVEAGPEEEAALQDLVAREPSRLMIMEGPTLIDRLPSDVWDQLSQALSLRGIPGFMAAKFQPWYVAVLLAIPPCAMAEMKDPKGLDGMVIDTALASGIPVQGLEPFDTVFRIFDAMSEAEMIGMIQTTLAVESRAEDYSATLADSYFAGESWMIWEYMREESYALPGYSRERVDAEFAAMQENLMDTRNRGWIPVLTEAAGRGPVFAAFGALHLPGQAGVLNLLQEEGFTVEPLPQ